MWGGFIWLGFLRLSLILIYLRILLRRRMFLGRRLVMGGMRCFCRGSLGGILRWRGERRGEFILRGSICRGIILGYV